MRFDNISIIVPYKSADYERERNWNFLKSRYETLMPGAEICIGEYDLDSYNRSKAINNGVMKSTRDILLLVDADIMFDIEGIKVAMEIIKSHKVVYPYNKLIRLSKYLTDELINRDEQDIKNISIDNESDEYLNPISSICLITKDLFKKVGGFDEKFKGWGYEDTAFYLSLKYVNKEIYKLEEYCIYHLYHEYEAKYKNDEHLLRNECRLNSYYDEKSISNTIAYLKYINNMY